MDAIREVLSLLDRNSEALPEGEYLNACNKLKDIYNRMENMPLYDTVSDDGSEENENSPPRDPRLMMTITEIHKRIKYHQKMIREHAGFNRLTKRLKILAMQQYAKFNGVNENNIDEIIEMVKRDFGDNEKRQRERFYMPYLEFANAHMARIRAMHAAEIEDLRLLF
jgi:hypothetical protein